MQTHPQQSAEIAKTVAENGRVLATLDDWRAMGFLVVLFFIVMAVERWSAARGMRAERAEMRKEREQMRLDMQAERNKLYEVADKFTAVAERLGENANRVVTQLEVLKAVSSRVEARNDVQG